MSELTTIANERVGIVEACNLIGMDDIFEGGNLKFYCPFGHIYHKDGGASKAFKLYPESNSAYCFACPAYYTPVKLLAADRNLEDDSAAEYLLQITGYVPPSLEERWENARTVVREIDTDSLAAALATYCRRIDPNWEVNQFEEPQATVFRRCVELTNRIKTDDEATEWLAKTKTLMRQYIEG